MQKLGYYKHEKKKKDVYVPKKYEQMQYPGQRIQIECVQTDNGQEFTKYFGHDKRRELSPTMFQFYSLDDLQRQLKRYMREYNNTPMRPLGWKSPNEYLANFFLTTMCNKCLTNLQVNTIALTVKIFLKKRRPNRIAFPFSFINSGRLQT